MAFEIKNTFSNFEKYKDISSMLVIDGAPSLTPKVSILIPTFKRPQLLKEAIESALSQNFPYDYEVVVVDNDPDETEEIDTLVNSFLPANIRLYRNAENIGMFGNWNRCISVARGEYISILNDDDVLSPVFLRECYKKHETAMVISTYATFFNSHPLFNNVSNNQAKFKPLSLADLMNQTPVAGSLGMLMKKSLAEEIGGFDSDEWPTADYWFAMRYFLKYGAIKTNAVMAGYRWLDNESLKETTIKGFIKNDSLLRNEIINTLDISKLKKKMMYSLSDFSAFLSKKYFDKFIEDFNKQDISNKKINQFGKLNYFFRALNRFKKYMWVILIGNNYRFKS